MVYYFKGLQHKPINSVLVILAASILGILGSYGVAWFGIRINTTANSRAAFASLKGNSLKTLFIPLQAGMSIGLLLVCVELACMIGILLFVPPLLAGPCFIGFAIGESLGASALRIGGGIFTKIADIGSDLMKIVFNLPEDDPKNPGVIADCTGDNAGDSVGPTADGFETYGVTSVALIAFLALALVASPILCGELIIWLFAIQALMVLASLGSFYLNKIVANARYGGKKDFNWEAPLTDLVWITSIVSIIVAFVASKLLLGDFCHFQNGGRRFDRFTAAKSVVGAGGHYFLWHARGARSSWNSPKFSSAPVPVTFAKYQRIRSRWRVAEHPVRSRRRKFFRILDGLGDSRAHVRCVSVLAKSGNARTYARTIHFCRADFCVWSRRLWLSRDGPGDDCRG
ncbi:MAG: sodium/proton-translocating pyrophosphatase [Limisphaerales bacterium]